MKISRRQFIQVGASALGATVAGCQPVPSTSLNLDLDNPEDRLTALAKLRGSIDGAPVMWWMKGTRFGVVDEVVEPLFNMLIGSFLTMKPVEDGFMLNMLEMSYFTNLETGEVMDEFLNPYTGKTVQIPEQRLGPYPVKMTTTGVILPDVPAFGDIDLTTRVGPAIVHMDDVWIRDDSSVKVDSDHPMMGKHTYNELVTYRGKLSDINNPELASAPAEIMFQSVTSWREWFEADDVGGHTTARATGTKIKSIDEFPPEYLEAARKRHPEIIADPLAALNTPPKAPGGH
ncbi:MAG: DUF1838 family protein [Gammaproteobacteria bacterium]